MQGKNGGVVVTLRQIGDWIRTEIRATGMTQKDFADQAGIGYSTLNQLINGRYWWDGGAVDVINRIEAVLGKSVPRPTQPIRYD